MSVARNVEKQLERASWIRRMFEEGARMKAERGAENVFDFTLGNPDPEPPAAVIEALRRIVGEDRPGIHRYMPNAGFPEVRRRVAERLKRDTGLEFTAGHVLMTVGSAGAINTFLRAILDPGDEVIVPVPFFSEYPFYIANHAGVMVPVETHQDFSLDLGAIERAVTPRTRAIFLNSPHNPTGVIYPEADLRRLGELVDSLPHPVTVVSDEPYKPLVYDGRRQPETAALIRRSVIAHSWSKAFSIPGERIGCLAISPRLKEAAALFDACSFTIRILGYVNAPSLWQWVIAESLETPTDVDTYQRKRDLLCGALESLGYRLQRPQGAFYVFPRSPIADDVAFVRILQQEGVLVVPGSGFGRAGYLRLSLTVPLDTITRSIPGFERALQKCRS